MLCPFDQGAMAEAAVAKRMCRLFLEIMLPFYVV
jgi:hypothetical protein